MIPTCCVEGVGRTSRLVRPRRVPEVGRDGFGGPRPFARRVRGVEELRLSRSVAAAAHEGSSLDGTRVPRRASLWLARLGSLPDVAQ